jgi:hypothetical protein
VPGIRYLGQIPMPILIPKISLIQIMPRNYAPPCSELKNLQDFLINLDFEDLPSQIISIL